MRSLTLLQIWLCCATANLLYQAIGLGDYTVALERSYFQGSALLMVWAWARFTDMPQEGGPC